MASASYWDLAETDLNPTGLESHARGSARLSSDLGVLVIEPEVENTALEAVRLMRAVGDLRLLFETLQILVADEHCGRTAVACHDDAIVIAFECAWTSYPSRSGPASATSGRSMRSTCWRILTW